MNLWQFIAMALIVVDLVVLIVVVLIIKRYNDIINSLRITKEGGNNG